MNQAISSGQVSAGCLLFTLQNHGGCSKKDVEDLILYSQLAATKKFSRFNDVHSWKSRWLEALAQFGAALSSHESMSLSAADLEPATPWDWVIRHMPPFISAQAMVDCQKLTRMSFGAAPDQPAVRMLELHATEAGVPERLPDGAQRVGVQFCMAGPMSSLELAVLTFTHRTSLPPDFLFQKLTPADLIGNVEVSFYSMRLMELVYAPFREKIDVLLKDRRAQTVSPLTGVTHEH